MTARLVRDAGAALYGSRWQSEMARDLGVSDRTMRRWTAVDVPVPAGVRAELLRLCVERAAVLDGLIERLR